MGDQDHKQDDDLQKQYQYYYNSSQPQSAQVPKSNYLYTDHTQTFTDIAIDGQTQSPDVVMPGFPSEYYVAPAESYDGWQNYRAASVGTAATSFVNVNTPSATTDGSYVMVPTPSHHTRTYSENSSGQASEGPLFSVPGDPEPWTPGSAFAVDKEAMDRDTVEEDAQSSMPHDQQRVLAGLSSPEPRTVFNPYVPLENPGPVVYQESMTNYQTSSSCQPLSYALPSRPARAQNMFDDPWTPVEQRIPLFPPGFVAFAPSPGPNVENYAGVEYGTSVSVSPQSRKPTHQSQGKRSRSGRTSSAKGKEKDHSPGWEHVVVAKGGLLRVSEIPKKENRGCRTGELDYETKEKARRIRKVHACWNCWNQKVPCSEPQSEGEPCNRCKSLSKKQSSLTAHQLCWRSGFKDYESTFFPEFMHAHLRKSKIEDLISEHTTGFLDTVIVVEVSTGSVFKPMRLHTNTFEAIGNELLEQSILTPPEADQAALLVRMASVPVGILGLSVTEMRKKCNKHVEDMISNTKYAEQATSGDVSGLPSQILEIVGEYVAAKKDVSLLQNALKLHAIHYFMGCLITFNDRSVRELYSRLAPGMTPQAYLSSRLLNRQIKYVMHKLHREITLQVLEDLERSLRSRTKDSWGPSFCTILILCLCIEGLQTAADVMVVCNIQEKGGEASYNRNQSSNACEELDEYPFRQCKKLFHDIYRSHKDGSSGGRGEKAFNPLKMAAEEGRTGLDLTTEGMVRSIYGVVCSSWAEIVQLSERPAIINLGYTVAAHDIKTNNTGRLAAKFLRSFFPD